MENCYTIEQTNKNTVKKIWREKKAKGNKSLNYMAWSNNKTFAFIKYYLLHLIWYAIWKTYTKLYNIVLCIWGYVFNYYFIDLICGTCHNQHSWNIYQHTMSYKLFINIHLGIFVKEIDIYLITQNCVLNFPKWTQILRLFLWFLKKPTIFPWALAHK